MEVMDEALHHSRSHSGGLVSPTDRPTISAMTASRISRAKARIMYFCRVKNRLLWHFQVVPCHWTLRSCIIDICKGFYLWCIMRKTHIPSGIFSGISLLFWSLPSHYKYIRLRWRRSSQCCSPFLPVNDRTIMI